MADKPKISYVEFSDITPYLKRIHELDIIGYDFNGTAQWYIDRYEDNLGAVAVFDRGFMIGYAFICGIKEPYYRAIKNNVLIGDISVNKHMYSNLNSPYLYLSSTVVIPSERGKGYCTEMTRRLLEKYYAPDKHIISLACTETQAILQKCGFMTLHQYLHPENEKYQVTVKEP